MNVLTMINTNIINLNLQAKNKLDAIEQIAEMLQADNRLNDFDNFVADVFKREKIESTNMDIGVAIPHSNSPYVKKTSIAIARMNEAIDWEDGEEPVRSIFLFAVSSEEVGVSHLDIIAKTAVILIDDDFIEFLNKVDDKQELIDRINEMIGGQS